MNELKPSDMFHPIIWPIDPSLGPLGSENFFEVGRQSGSYICKSITPDIQGVLIKLEGPHYEMEITITGGGYRLVKTPRQKAKEKR